MSSAGGGLIMCWSGSATQPQPGLPGERSIDAMQRFLDKWFLPFLFVLIGAVIVWGLWRGLS